MEGLLSTGLPGLVCALQSKPNSLYFIELCEAEEDDPWSVELAFHVLAPPSLTSLLPLAEHYGTEQSRAEQRRAG